MLSEINAKEILSILRALSIKSSLDCNDISISIIKEIIPFVVNAFTYNYFIFCLFIIYLYLTNMDPHHYYLSFSRYLINYFI